MEAGSLQGVILASDGNLNGDFNFYGTSGAYTFKLTPAQMATFSSSSSTSRSHHCRRSTPR